MLFDISSRGIHCLSKNRLIGVGLIKTITAPSKLKFVN